MGLIKDYFQHKKDVEFIIKNDLINKNRKTMLDANNNYLFARFMLHFRLNDKYTEQLTFYYLDLKVRAKHLFVEQNKIVGRTYGFYYKTDGFLVSYRDNGVYKHNFIPYCSMVENKDDLHRYILYAFADDSEREYSLISIKEVKDYECYC